MDEKLALQIIIGAMCCMDTIHFSCSDCPWEVGGKCTESGQYTVEEAIKFLKSKYEI